MKTPPGSGRVGQAVRREAQDDGWFAIESGGRVRKRKGKIQANGRRIEPDFRLLALCLVSQTPNAALSAPVPTIPA